MLASPGAFFKRHEGVFFEIPICQFSCNLYTEGQNL